MEMATLAGGCFWCTEAIFKRVKGVSSVTSGYSGGAMDNPDYENVSTGSTGHAEAIQITFDPKIISYEKLVEIFFHLHDPTTLNRQGNDIGTQYRSVIFYHSSGQKETAENLRERIDDEHIYQNKIITEIVPFENFYKAEDYHQNYYEKNREAGYCRVIIDPKIKKLLREFKEEVK
ncbi:MAG: peptide-methionine (S)-S-oxide reductase MsrA [Candidatus Levybacteria bacterium]|nr:peptide-methionine (S)-S-oxide reductase MsrA [Candidatus Levybacteria bacterium]